MIILTQYGHIVNFDNVTCIRTDGYYDGEEGDITEIKADTVDARGICLGEYLHGAAADQTMRNLAAAIRDGQKTFTMPGREQKGR